MTNPVLNNIKKTENIQEQDMQQNTQQGRGQCTNSNTQAH
jgi:hypothetical protein